MVGLPRFMTLLLIAGQSTASAPIERYRATARPIDVATGTAVCVAVDLHDPHGVWWWEPGRSGCGSRSTGPGVFHARGATIVRSTRNGAYEVGFRLATHSTTRPFLEVRLRIEDDTVMVRGQASGGALVRRSNLEIPEQPPRGPSAAR